VTLRHLELTGGRESEGGCILNKGPLRIYRCTLHTNYSTGRGGAIFNEPTGTLLLDHCTIALNEGSQGSVVFQRGSTVCEIKNSTLTRNKTSHLGGSRESSGSYRVGVLEGGTFNLSHTVVSGNSFGRDVPFDVDPDRNPPNIILHEGSPSYLGEGARLGPLGYFGGSIPTVVPMTGSPLIDAGLAETATLDQRGASRVIGTSVDLGAAEFGAIPEFDPVALVEPVVTLIADRENYSLNREGMSLREAINLAQKGTSISFHPSLEGQTLELIRGPLSIWQDLEIDAMNLAGRVTISAGDQFRIFNLEPLARCHFSGLRLLRGNAGEGRGGGIFSSNELTLTRCEIADCQARAGGGVVALGMLNLVECSILRNQAAEDAGGLLIRSLQGPNPPRRQIRGCTFASNSAGNNGGAIGSEGAARQLEMTACTLASNRALRGGGIYGLILELDFCTITRNVATLFGGGLSPNSAQLRACLVSGNVAPSNPNFGQQTISIAGSLINGEAHLGELQDNGGPTLTIAPLPGSPAIDPADAPETYIYERDQRGYFRSAGGRADFGAVEVGSEIFPDLLTDPLVTTSGDHFEQTSLPDLATLSLREAIAYAAPGATIRFSPNLAGEIFFMNEGPLLLFQSVTIDGEDHLPLLHGNGVNRIFDVRIHTPAKLQHLNLTGGVVAGSGGAIFNEGELTLDHIMISDCRASGGGAIFSEADSRLDINNFRFAHNESTTSGGACLLTHGGNYAFSRGTFHGNSAGGGGAISGQGVMLIDRVTFSDNRANENGGAISFFDHCSIANSTISGNSARRGGGIFHKWGTLSLDHVTIAHNKAELYFAGVYVEDGEIEAGNSIIADNYGPTGESPVPDPNTVRHPNLNAALSVDRGGNLIRGKAFLSPLGNYGGEWQTMVPLNSSPALDIGVSSSHLTDQRGVVRPVGAAPDAGAVERGGFPELEFEAIANPVVRRADDPDEIDLQSLSLRHALSVATSGATIHFASNLAGQTLTLTSELIVRNDIVIDGVELPSPVTLRSAPLVRHFLITHGVELTLKSLTLEGLPLESEDEFLTGGLKVYGSAVLEDCLMVRNRAIFGGAIEVQEPGSLSVQRSTFSENRSIFRAGAIFVGKNTGTTVENSTFAHNLAHRTGGAFAVEGNLTLLHSSLTQNSAYQSGGGVAILQSGGITPSFEANNCIIAGNFAPVSNEVFGEMPPDLTTNLLDGDPLLAPLGNYGGSQPTMPPLAGSPVIGLGSGANQDRDQRGTSRPVVGAFDSGAVQSGAFPGLEPDLMTNPVVNRFDDLVQGSIDPQNLSLREAMALAAPGSVITFPSSGSPHQVTLRKIPIVSSRELTLAGSGLPSSVELNGGAKTGIFHFGPTADVTLRNLTLTKGTAREGGAIANSGELQLDLCRVEDCRAEERGGAIFNGLAGVLTLTDCSIDRNYADEDGGGLYNLGMMTCFNSTISRNEARNDGAGIFLDGGEMVLNQVTVAENIREGVTLSGGTSTFNFVTIASNRGANLSFVRGVGYRLTVNSSIITTGDPTDGPDYFGDQLSFSGSDPFLAPLGHYGGITETMPPLTGSATIDAGGDSDEIIDQRGAARVIGTKADLGATEAGAFPEQELQPLTSPVVTTVKDEIESSSGDPAPLSLREAIALSLPGSVITFAPELAGQVIEMELGEFVIPRPLVIDGSVGGRRISLDAQGKSCLVSVPSLVDGDSLNLRSLRLTNAQGEALFSRAPLELTDCLFEKNLDGSSAIWSLAFVKIDQCIFKENGGALYGGALFLSGGGTITDCHFEENFADAEGGAINSLGSESLKIISSTFVGNTSGSSNGGAIQVTNPATLIDRCFFSRNRAGIWSGGGKGGAVFTGSSDQENPILITCSTFADNEARFGGALVGGGFVEIEQCTFARNQATFEGGGIYLESGSGIWKMSHCTLSGNTAVERGGGIRALGELSYGNSIISGNDDMGHPSLAASNLFATGISTDQGGNFIAGDALLEPLGEYGGPTPTMLPKGNSPVIDLASPSALSTDQRGMERVVGDRPDAGAVEFQGLGNELDSVFFMDSDGDGASNGLEFAMGRSAYQSDADSPLTLRFRPGQRSLSFGFEPDSSDKVVLKITSSIDLRDFDQVISSNETIPFDAPNDDGLLQMDDPGSPDTPRVFYRLEASPRR
jgi:fibronectin-binding autotransporter adhesin